MGEISSDCKVGHSLAVGGFSTGCKVGHSLVFGRISSHSRGPATGALATWSIVWYLYKNYCKCLLVHNTYGYVSHPGVSLPASTALCADGVRPPQAMNLLYDLRDPAKATPEKLHMSPLSAWVCRHGSGSLTKLMQLKVSDFKAPLVFEGELPMRRFVAYIDPEDQFSITDKLSQVTDSCSALVGCHTNCA